MLRATQQMIVRRTGVDAAMRVGVTKRAATSTSSGRGSGISFPVNAYRLVGIAFVFYLLLVLRLWIVNRASEGEAIDELEPGRSAFSFGEAKHSETATTRIPSMMESSKVEHLPARSSTKLFVTMGSYVIDGDATSGTHASVSTNDLILVLVGVGDLTEKAQPSKEAAMNIPPRIPSGIKFLLKDKFTSETYKLSNVLFHSNGTAYQGKISPSRGVLWFGERAVWLSVPVPKANTALQHRLVSNIGDFELSMVIENEFGQTVFDSRPTAPSLVLSTVYLDKPLHNLTLCSSAIYGLMGTKWIIEWIEYHRAAGFDSLDLYVHQVGPMVTRVLEKYVADNSPAFFVRVHDWTKMIDNGPIGFNDHTGVGFGVQGDAWEHGQRLTRNDCYLRNRGRSQWIMFSDIDELFTSKMPGKTVWEGPISSFCEKEYQNDPNHIACSFSSVTTPPNAKIPNESLLILERIDTSEASCQTPYNCGRFHYGREKYAIRTASGSLNPNGPFFYHAISQNYDISEKHHVLIPNHLGVVRHYAGHFSHSRKGGLPPNKAMYNPLPQFVLEKMRNRIFNEDLGLKRLYLTPGQMETFLKLDRITDLWRFAKAGERPEQVDLAAPPKAEAIQRERYMTFEYFGGRLNNQLWTLDWVFRVALALNRTAVIGDPQAREHYIGWPSSAEDSSLWDMESLRNAPFKFKFAWEVTDAQEKALVFGDKSQLPPECVWDFNESGKYLMLWASKTNCQQRRIHFSSGGGLVHSYKADTRKYGVDPLVYWKHMRLNREVERIIQQWWASTSPRGELEDAVGLHFRSWREANGDAAHALKVCTRLSQKLLSYAAKRFDAVKSKACQIQCGKTVENVDVQQFWNENNLDVTCKSASRDNVRVICGQGLEEVQSGKVDFFVATDHETREADQVFEELNGKMMFSVDTETFISKFVERDRNGLTARKYARAILPILLDVSGLIQAGRFYGSPASTLSQAVCLWRRAFDKREEVPGMCQLVWYSTFSDVCEEMCSHM